jgi:hypothetical protein
MTFKHAPVYDSSTSFEQLLAHKAIKFYLNECGGYIAGGLAEKEFNHYNIENYLKTDLSQYNGDVDIYFTSQEGLNKAIEYSYEASHTCTFKESELDCYPTHDLSNYEQFIALINYSNPGKYNRKSYNRYEHIRHVEPSCTDISYQVFVDVKFSNVGVEKDYPVKIQLIGKDFIGKPEEILNTFDFANVQIAYYFKDNQLFCCSKDEIIPDRFRNRNRLRVVNSHSPLLMHRIYKYMTHRGYEGVTEESKQHIIDWLIRARAGEFKNPVFGITLWEDALNNRVIRRAIYDKTIPDNALPLIIGKVITEKRVYRGYRRYDYVQIDEAMAAIKERKSSQNS